MSNESASARETPEILRRLAAWQRGYAEVGGGDNSWRLRLADYLDRRADEEERARQSESASPRK